MPAWIDVAEEKALPGDRYRVKATLDDKIVINDGRASLRAAIRRRQELKAERQFDVVFIVDIGDPNHPNGIVLNP